MGTPIITPEPTADTPGHRRTPRRAASGARRSSRGDSAPALATLLVASLLIFAMTELLPGDVASVVLGRSATPEAVAGAAGGARASTARSSSATRTGSAGLRHRRPRRLDGRARPGGGERRASASGSPSRCATARSSPGIAFVIFLPLALTLGVLAGISAGRPIDYVLSLTALAVNALPEFVIATFLIVIFFTPARPVPAGGRVRPGRVAARPRSTASCCRS